MNIDVVGRMRPQTQGEGKALLVEASGRVAAQAGGPYFGFHTLHATKASTYDVFRLSVDTLLDLYLAGYNTCLLVAGESGSGKSYTLTGESSSQAGLVKMVLDHLFAKLSKERYHHETRMSKQDPDVTVQMVEVYNELIKDLLHSPTGGSIGLLDLTESAEKGVHAKKVTTIPVTDASSAYAYFRQGWGRRTEATTDHGPARRNAAMIFHIDLAVKVGDNPQLYKSRFTVAELPGLEKLSTDPKVIQLREGPKLSQALVALNQVTSTLSSHPFPDRLIHYSDSKLTQLLQEELGGNFKTRALICLKPKTEADISNAILKFCTSLSHIRNFPIVNDSLAQGLLTQKGAKILELKQQAGIGPVHMTSTAPVYSDSAEENRRLQTENLVLKDHNERLQLRLDRLQNKFGDVANTRTDLSQQLLLSEEEKLKVSQSLVDLQIENNKIREEAEAAKFELTNKIILLENQVMELEAERDKHKKTNRYAKERLSETEKDRKDLADEYVVLKTNYLALTKEHEKELNRNEELAIELLNLVNNKAGLMRQVIILTNSSTADVGDPNAEIERVRAIVAKNSSGRVPVSKISGSQKDRDAVEQTLFASKKKHDTEVMRLKNELGEGNKKMESRMTGIMKELADTRNLARERQQKISELNAKLITIRGEKQAMDTQLNRLQHKVKDLGEDFRARLVKYVEDIADYVDKGSQGQSQQTDERLRDYTDSMLKDIRRSHKEREQQLSEAAQVFRSRLQKTVHDYEEVLVAYRNLRQTCEARGFDKEDLGPDETMLRLSDTDIQTSHLKELDKLKGELSRNRGELDTLKMRYGLFGDDKDGVGEVTAGGRTEIWGAMRKQMREFTLNTQQQLEQERARLLSENSVMKEQLRETQQYIDSHLARYKQEVVRLRKMLGMNDDGIVLTDRVKRVPLHKLT
ncbi:hypothetical protein ACOMHN_037727 [Nucella lapillus]